MSKSSLKKLYFCFCVLIIPLIVGVMALRLKSATGPFWLGANFDPAYLYLISFVYIVDGIAPIFTDHPGTTLQILGAFVIKLLSLGLNVRETVTEVLKDPEYFLHAVYNAMICLYVMSFSALSLYSWKRSRSLIFTFCVQLSSLLFLTHRSYTSGNIILPIIANINSETLLITFINIYLICLLKIYFDQNRTRWSMSVILGVVCGLALATKLTFIPLCLGAFIIVKGLRQKGLLLGLVVCTYGLATMPIWPRYDIAFSWWTNLITHSGTHGAGTVGIIDVKAYFASIRWIVSQYSLLFTVVAAAFISSWFIFRPREKEEVERMRHSRFFITVLCLICLAQYAITAKQSGSHYMVPGIALCGLLLALTYDLFKDRVNTKIIGAGLCILMIFLFIRAEVFHQRLKEVNTDLHNFSNKIYSSYDDCIIFGYYRSSRKETALEFAEAHGIEKHYSKLLKSIYPEALFYNRWLKTFHDFDKNVMVSQVIGERQCVLMYGSNMDFSKGIITATEIASERTEYLYKMTHTTLDEAHRSYLMARFLASEKDYKMAFLHALRAKKLGRPGMDKYLFQLRKMIKD